MLQGTACCLAVSLHIYSEKVKKAKGAKYVLAEPGEDQIRA